MNIRMLAILVLPIARPRLRLFDGEPYDVGAGELIGGFGEFDDADQRRGSGDRGRGLGRSGC